MSIFLFLDMTKNNFITYKVLIQKKLAYFNGI